MLVRTQNTLVEDNDQTPLERAWDWVLEISSLDDDEIPRHLQENAQHVATLPNGSGALITLPGNVRIGNQNLITGFHDPDSNGRVIVQYLEEDTWRTLWTPHFYQTSLNVYDYMASYHNRRAGTPSAKTPERRQPPQLSRSNRLTA